jgi:hypothetical protein
VRALGANCWAKNNVNVNRQERQERQEWEEGEGERRRMGVDMSMERILTVVMLTAMTTRRSYQ